MTNFIKQLIENISEDDNARELGNEEAFREIVSWSIAKEFKFYESLNKLVENELDRDELVHAETISLVAELVKHYKG